MSRPLRIQFAGAIYHLTARGNNRRPIVRDDHDRHHRLRLLHNTRERYHWLTFAWCLMGNHYHLLVETLQPNLARGMRHLNGLHAQHVNRRHRRVGHLFQARYHRDPPPPLAPLPPVTRSILRSPTSAPPTATTATPSPGSPPASAPTTAPSAAAFARWNARPAPAGENPRR